MQTRTSTIIVAERPLLREGVASFLSSSGYKVIATASRASDIHDVLTATRGRAVIIFGVAGANNNYETVAENIGLFRSLSPEIKIVVVAETPGPIDLQQIGGLELDGYILNLSSREILLKALELTLSGQKIFVLGEAHHSDMNGGGTANGRSKSADTSEPHFPRLSPRELEVLVCLCRGDSNKQIARSCDMAESTVKVHLKTILRKLYAQNRTQAAIVAIALGLVSEKSETAIQPSAIPCGNSFKMTDFEPPPRGNNGRGVDNEKLIA
jgi:two-component system, NarL family, nitrate/nitrite response regulator NarL